jgi:hypothetical protein
MNDNQPTPIIPTEPVFTITELMKRWKCTRKSILDAVHRGELEVFKIGSRTYRVTLAEVLRFEKESGAKTSRGAA